MDFNSGVFRINEVNSQPVTKSSQEAEAYLLADTFILMFQEAKLSKFSVPMGEPWRVTSAVTGF